VVGDAVTRSITITIDGTTPILLPAVMPELTSDAAPAPLRAYPKEPVVTENEQRGILSGARTETTTYVAQGGGDLTLDSVSIDWFNLDSGQVETVELGGFTLSITAPPPPLPGVLDYARWAVIALAGLGLIWGFTRLIWPRLRRLLTRTVAAWHGSERYAHRRVLRAIRAQDLNATLAALGQWAGFYRDVDLLSQNVVSEALAQVGASKYGKESAHAESTGWANIARSYSKLRTGTKKRQQIQRARDTLPDLNPSAPQN